MQCRFLHAPAEQRCRLNPVSADPSANTPHSNLKFKQAAWTVFDSNRDGSLSASELKTIMTRLGYPMEDEDVEEMMDVGDEDGNMLLSFEEFRAQVRGWCGAVREGEVGVREWDMRMWGRSWM